MTDKAKALNPNIEPMIPLSGVVPCTYRTHVK